MRLRDRPIQNFQRLDTHVSESQAFANTRDLQVARRNHNILVARRTKRSVLQIVAPIGAFYSAEFTAQPVYSYQFASGRAASLVTAMTIIEQLVLISQHTRKLRLFLRAQKYIPLEGDGGFDPLLFPRLRALHSVRDNDTVEMLTINDAGVATSYSCDVSVPHNFDRDQTYYRGHGAFIFSLQAKCKLAAEPFVAGVGLSDIGPNWFAPSAAGLSAGGSYGRSMIFSDTAIDSRICTRYMAIGAHGRYYIDRPFARYPRPGDTVSEYDIVGVRIHSLSLFEKPVTDYALTSGDM